MASGREDGVDGTAARRGADRSTDHFSVRSVCWLGSWVLCRQDLPGDDRAALWGIVYVLRKGMSWVDVPAERVGRSGVTAWRRLRDWTEAGVRPRLHEVLLAELRAAGLLDMDDAAVDGSHVRAPKGGLTPDLRRSTGPVPAARTT